MKLKSKSLPKKISLNGLILFVVCELLPRPERLVSFPFSNWASKARQWINIPAKHQKFVFYILYSFFKYATREGMASAIESKQAA